MDRLLARTLAREVARVTRLFDFPLSMMGPKTKQNKLGRNRHMDHTTNLKLETDNKNNEPGRHHNVKTKSRQIGSALNVRKEKSASITTYA